MNIDKIRFIDYYVGIPLIQFFRPFKRLIKKNFSRNIRKILLIKFFGLGNIVLSSPVFFLLKKFFPYAEIHYLTLKENIEILRCYSDYIDKIKYIDINNITFSTLSLIKDLRNENYDVIIDLDQFSRYSALLTFLINKSKSIGFKTKDAYRHYLYDIQIPYTGTKHVTEEFVNLLKGLGIDRNKLQEKIKLLPLKVPKNFRDRVKKFLKKYNLIDKTIIGIHPGTSENAPQRQWPYFKELIEKLLLETNYNIVITAGPKEYEKSENLIKNLKLNQSFKKRVIISKEISLLELPELIKYFSVYISNDTGPLHIAAAQKVFVIGLYGPNTPKLYGPYTDKCYVFYKSLPCSPCITNFNNKKTTCKNPICMKKISVNEVFLKILEVLKNKNEK